MNLVVVARRPEVAERCAATIQELTGRHPSRTIVIRSADPDGPSWLDARIEAHCVMPREDAPETCAETIHLTCGGEAGRHLVGDRHAAPHPRPAGHGLVAGRAAVHQPARPRPPGRSGPPRRRRLDLERRRPRPPARDGRSSSRPPSSRSATSRWSASRAGARRSPRSSTIRTSCRTCARCGGSRSPTRPTTRPARTGSTNLVKPVYHVGWLASRLGLSVDKPLAPVAGPGRRGQGRGAAKPAIEPGHGGDPVGRPWRGRRGRPAGRLADAAGTTLRVELLAERRGSELRADVTAEAETVHVRVWQDGVEVLERHFRRPAPDRGRPAGRGDRGRPARPGRGRCAALGGRARRAGRAAGDAT